MMARPTGAASSQGSNWNCSLAAAFFIVAGANHFVNPTFYRRIVPPSLPNPATWVVISGIAEMAGGAGLLRSQLRRPAGWGLIALLLAIFPANLYMAWHPERFNDLPFPRIMYWARLPLQALMIAWVWRVAGLSARRSAAQDGARRSEAVR